MRAPAELGSRNKPFTVGRWALDPAASRLERRGEQVHLEPRLVDLLCHFASSPRRVISKAELIDAVWQGRNLDNAAVARAVAELRKALGDSPQAPRYIETIPKRGYRLVARVALPGHWRRQLAVAVAATAALIAVLVVASRGSEDRGEAAVIDPSDAAYGSSDARALQAYRFAAEAFERGGQAGNETAVVHLTRALELDPEFALAQANLAEAYAVRATWYGVEGDWAPAALVEASRAVSLAPELSTSHRALAHALSTNGRFGEAQSSFLRALELSPGDEEITFRLGEIQFYRGEWPEALATLASLTQGDTNPGELKCEVGNLLYHLDYREEALAWFEAALAKEPFQICSNIRLALAEMAAGELDAARSRVRRLSTAHAACEACDQVLGEIALRQGRPAEARHFYELAIGRTVGWKSTFIRIRLARWVGDAETLSTLASSLERQLTAGVDIWFPAWLLAIVNAELGDETAALYWHGEARARGYLDWRADLAEPAFASVQDLEAFRLAVSEMQARIGEMQREIEDLDLLKATQPQAMRSARGS